MPQPPLGKAAFAYVRTDGDLQPQAEMFEGQCPSNTSALNDDTITFESHSSQLHSCVWYDRSSATNANESRSSHNR